MIFRQRGPRADPKNDPLSRSSLPIEPAASPAGLHGIFIVALSTTVTLIRTDATLLYTDSRVGDGKDFRPSTRKLICETECVQACSHDDDGFIDT